MGSALGGHYLGMSIAPGEAHSDVWTGKTQVASTFPVSCDVLFDNELPNGSYGEMSMTGGMKLHVPSGIDYTAVGTAAVDAWIKSRGSMMNMNVNRNFPGAGASNYKEDWRIVSIEYKGGMVNATDLAKEGMHNFTLGLVQTVTAPQVACCVVM